MARRVLVPIDGSEQAQRALDYTLTHHSDEEITILHVNDPMNTNPYIGMGEAEMVDFQDVHAQSREQAERLLTDAETQADERGVTVATELRDGATERTIIEYAEEHEVDHIVIGSHGRSGVSRILLGSIAETVVRRSPVPVTIVR